MYDSLCKVGRIGEAGDNLGGWDEHVHMTVHKIGNQQASASYYIAQETLLNTL